MSFWREHSIALGQLNQSNDQTIDPENYDCLNAKTDFAEGSIFTSSGEVREYFSKDARMSRFNNGQSGFIGPAQDWFDAMAELVIKNKWNCSW